MYRLICCLVLALLMHPAVAAENELHLARFSAGDMNGWKVQSLGLMKTKTAYSIAREGDHSFLLGQSRKSASGMIYKLSIDPREYAMLSWSWKIDHTIKKGDERVKEGDDFAARVYVLFPRGFFSQTRAICYVWANHLPKGSHITSPFSANIITVAEDSGEELAGKWTLHQRNVYEDYRSFFHEEPGRIGAVAVMTDSDNTGESAVGYYGDISLLRLRKPEEPGLKGKEGKGSLKEQKNRNSIREPSGDLRGDEGKPKEQPADNNKTVVPPPAAPQPQK